MAYYYLGHECEPLMLISTPYVCCHLALERSFFTLTSRVGGFWTLRATAASLRFYNDPVLYMKIVSGVAVFQV